MDCKLSILVFTGLVFSVVCDGESRPELHYIGIILPQNNSLSWSLSNGALAAIEEARDEVFKQHPKNFDILPAPPLHNDSLMTNPDCSAKDAFWAMTAIWHTPQHFNDTPDSEVRAFIGPVCDNSLHVASVLASILHIPLITPGGFTLSHDIRDGQSLVKDEYSWTIRMGPSYDKIAEFVASLTQVLYWDDVALIYEDQHPSVKTFDDHLSLTEHGLACDLVMDRINFAVKNFNKGTFQKQQPLHPGILKSNMTSMDMVNLLLQTSRSARAVVICSHPREASKFLQAMSLLNHAEEYAFLFVDLFGSKTELPWGDDIFVDDGDLKPSFKNLLTLRVQGHDLNKKKVILDKVQNRSKEILNLEDEAHESYLVNIYNSVLLYGHACIKTLAQEENCSGKPLLDNMKSSELDGVDGKVMINSQGDRVISFTLWDLKQGNYELVGSFSSDGSDHWDFNQLINGTVEWAGSTVPGKIPNCGYDGMQCHLEDIVKKVEAYNVAAIVLGVLFVVTLLFLVVACCLLRKDRSRRPGWNVLSKVKYENVSNRRDDVMELNLDEPNHVFDEEKRQDAEKALDIVHSLLPKSLALKVIRGQTINVGQKLECASIAVTGVVGFGGLVSQCRPTRVIDFLNRLNNLFDEVVKKFDAQKMTCPGDSYTVVSGIPDVNGDQHAAIIARVALQFHEIAKRVELPYNNKAVLQVKTGINTGPMFYALLGQISPRFSVFGDTVNLASYLESSGSPQQIQISSETKRLLDSTGTFVVSERNNNELPDSSILPESFWLLGENARQKSEKY